jgi:hypothetical protein
MAVIVGLALHEVPPLPSLAVIVAIIIGLNPVNRGLSRTIQRGPGFTAKMPRNSGTTL